MGRIRNLTQYEEYLRVLPRTFHALPLKDVGSIKQFMVCRAHLLTRGHRRLDQVMVKAKRGDPWQGPFVFSENFKYLANYKPPPKPKKKKWKLEIYVKYPPLVKRRSKSDNR